MAKSRKIIATIGNLERKNNSVYGNPAWSCELTRLNGDVIPAKTANNAMCGYAISGMVGAMVCATIHETAKGNVIIDYLDWLADGEFVCDGENGPKYFKDESHVRIYGLMKSHSLNDPICSFNTYTGVVTRHALTLKA